MITAWRITKAQFTREAFSGVGAQRYGGRWNSKGVAVVYTSDSLALAILEVVVHLPRPKHLKGQRAAAVQIKDTLVGTAGRLPRDWKTNMRATQRIGDEWIRRATYPILAVPSVLYDCSGEKPINYLMNPNHSDFDELQIGRFAGLQVDPRIL